MESETQTKDAIISDSGYSHSGSNRTSQGSGSSKSKHSNGSHSSGSGSYDETPKPNTSSDVCTHSDRNKDVQHQKKQKKTNGMSMPRLPETFTLVAAAADALPSTSSAMDIEVAPSEGALENVTPDVGENKNNELLLNISDPQNGTKIVEESMPEIWHEKDSIEVRDEKDVADSRSLSRQLAAENEGFCCLISMVDGLVLYTTPNLTSVLGFPKELWLGHSFIDFVHPKDRETFSKQVSTNITLFLIEAQEKIKEIKEHVFVYLRRHFNGSSAGKPSSYQAFDLTITIKQMPGHPSTSVIDPNRGLFLFIFAVPVRTVYKVPGERKVSPKFGMRHTATCVFTYVDPDVVANFGFLPQDMLGKSVFDFYHPEDMPFLKDVYTSVMKTCQVSGSMFRSKPYRFLVQNGDFALIETEWSGVTNPWSRRLEFVISLHQVLQGPLNPDVFDVPSDGEYRKIPQDVIEQGRMLQTEIIQLLTEEIPTPAATKSREGFKGCKELATIMGINNMTKLEVDVTPEFHHGISERDSVTLGEISPHHDLCDSKSSSETPPSYNQLNYNENISRFFQSNPKTTVTSDESTSNAMDTNGKSSEDCVPDQKSLWPIHNSEASGYDSTGNISSYELQSRTNVPRDAQNSSLLTESVLVRHNEDMENIMLQRHKKERSHIKDREGKKKYQNLDKSTNERLRQCSLEENNQGVKRTVADSWGNHDCRKMSKHEDFCDHENGNVQDPAPNCTSTQKVEQSFPGRNPGLWSPFSTAIPSNVQTDGPAVQHPGNMASNTGMSPLYYLPTFVQSRSVNNNNNNNVESQKYPMHYTPTFVLWSYNPVFLPQPMLLPNVPVIPMQSSSSSLNSMVANPEFLNPATCRQSTTIDNAYTNQQRMNTNSSTFHCDRPASQATSIKVEPGSMRDSIASASVVNKALSERSRKDFGLQSVCSPDTPLVSPPYGEIQLEQFNVTEIEESQKKSNQSETNYRTKKMDEESSWYSSSYSSLLKTDSASGSNDDSSLNHSAKNIRKPQRNVQSVRTKDPPWLQSVSISSDLIFKYQMAVRSLEDVLKSDLDILKKTEQPMMVNDQLRQLYIDMDLNGLDSLLSLDQGFSSSSSNSSSSCGSKTNKNLALQRQTRKKSHNSLMMMMCEDGAPLPSPESNS